MQFKKSLPLAFAASAMIFASSMAMAEGKPAADAKPADKEHKKPMTAEQQLQEKLDTLGLSDDQKAKIATLLADFKTASDSWNTTHGAELKELNKKISDAKSAATKDEAQIKQLNDQKKTLMDTEPSTKKLHDDIKAILTPEQAAKFDPKKEKEKAAGDKPKGEKKHDAK